MKQWAAHPSSLCPYQYLKLAPTMIIICLVISKVAFPQYAIIILLEERQMLYKFTQIKNKRDANLHEPRVIYFHNLFIISQSPYIIQLYVCTNLIQHTVNSSLHEYVLPRKTHIRLCEYSGKHSTYVYQLQQVQDYKG